ncbi:MAG: AbrB/MazE/SpoVT family DNA-binding domain-containing protein [Candidatus Omnitrophica bacterium]|nr:AbrB/MazE/SpoVT family DNA-binding domain-containing protein [Candidatus Omnitrophota bacterium]MBU4457673.1 AbrB/MazE/SpoVT family DNA-binding domain-containing protein [Candidatus Omnitrophota bacterium]
MVITRLKAKNQITIPQSVVERLHLKENELFQVDIEKSYIRLIPVEVKPKYTAKELAKIDKIVKKEKKRVKPHKAGSEFSRYINGIK